MKLGAGPHETHINNSDHSDGHLGIVRYYGISGYPKRCHAECSRVSECRANPLLHYTSLNRCNCGRLQCYLFLVQSPKNLGTHRPSVFIGGSVSIPLLLHRRHVTAKLHSMVAHNRFSLRSPDGVESAGKADHGDESPDHSGDGRLLYSRRLGIVEPVFGNLHNHHLRRFTLRTRRKVDAQWKLFALVHKSCKARRREALGKAGNYRISSNAAPPLLRPTTQWNRQMIAFRSNNAALEPITAFAHSSESTGGHFLPTR
jgi:hypothetical protein